MTRKTVHEIINLSIHRSPRPLNTLAVQRATARQRGQKLGTGRIRERFDSGAGHFDATTSHRAAEDALRGLLVFDTLARVAEFDKRGFPCPRQDLFEQRA